MAARNNELRHSLKILGFGVNHWTPLPMVNIGLRKLSLYVLAIDDESVALIFGKNKLKNKFDLTLLK
ncbi:hypothetical protein H5410_016866 [Solanum commersonii]|uniref:Uncharacterized protein n=1 Tax=Solanum commersonii TaxID=4109 RepID=A0A9J5ZYG9_SOLCO|nr:hypothetical protein H5410_016866 [Solanum commersonii]